MLSGINSNACYIKNVTEWNKIYIYTECKMILKIL